MGAKHSNSDFLTILQLKLGSIIGLDESLLTLGPDAAYPANLKARTIITGISRKSDLKTSQPTGPVDSLAHSLIDTSRR